MNASDHTAADGLQAPSAFLTLPGAVAATGLDAGVPAHYGNPVAEQRALIAGAIVDLSGRGVVTVTGPDRLSWLNSLSSQQLTGVSPGQSTETLLLGIDGRIEHAMKVLDDGVTTWLLVEAEEVDALVAWLDRMRFMLRVEVADQTDRYATIGSLGESSAVLDTIAATPNGVALVWHDPWASVTTGGFQYSTVEDYPGADWTWRETLIERTELAGLAERVAGGEVAAAGTIAAEALRVAAWRPRRALETDAKSIPHELDWMRSAVHLSKGCYRGQETVAKVHNLGHPPRRLTFLHLDGSDNVLPVAGDPVFVAAGIDPNGTGPNGTGQIGADPVGQITSSAYHYELGAIALAVIKRQTPVDAELVVRSDGSDIAAAQEVVVPPEAGAVVGRIRRMPRLNVRRR